MQTHENVTGIEFLGAAGPDGGGYSDSGACFRLPLPSAVDVNPSKTCSESGHSLPFIKLGPFLWSEKIARAWPVHPQREGYFPAGPLVKHSKEIRAKEALKNFLLDALVFRGRK